MKPVKLSADVDGRRKQIVLTDDDINVELFRIALDNRLEENGSCVHALFVTEDNRVQNFLHFFVPRSREINFGDLEASMNDILLYRRRHVECVGNKLFDESATAAQLRIIDREYRTTCASRVSPTSPASTVFFAWCDQVLRPSHDIISRHYAHRHKWDAYVEDGLKEIFMRPEETFACPEESRHQKNRFIDPDSDCDTV